MGFVGCEPVQDVVMMEYHNDAYRVWKDRGVKDKILVHIDGHIDFGWIADEDPSKLTSVKDRGELDRLLKEKNLWDFSGTAAAKINIANYIYPSMKEGIVKALYWVVPDPVWKKWRQRMAAKNILKHIAALAPAHSKIAGSVFVVPLSGLPCFNEPVLLDIDTDYFVTSSVTAGPPYYSARRVEPWTWPDEFIKSVAQKKIRSDLVTIAYSVEGGYTPVEWRFLGDELAELIRAPGGIDARGKKRAPDMNASCKTPYGNKGLKYFVAGRLSDAVREYSKVLSEDPGNVGAITGIGKVLFERKNYEVALKMFLEACSFDGGNAEVNYSLGRVLQKLREFAAAADSFKKAIECDPLFAPAHYELGRVYARQERIGDAIEELKIAKNCGLDGFSTRFSLAGLYRKKGNMYKARKEFFKGLWFINRLGPSYLLQGLLSVPRMVTRSVRVHQESKNGLKGI